MKDFFSNKNMNRMENNAKKLSTKMFEASKNSTSIETIYACMRLITFLLAKNFETKEQAYTMMAELFDVGDSLLKDLEENKIANWSK